MVRKLGAAPSPRIPLSRPCTPQRFLGENNHSQCWDGLLVEKFEILAGISLVGISIKNFLKFSGNFYQSSKFSPVAPMAEPEGVCNMQ